jgi:hypothetical protein
MRIGTIGRAAIPLVLCGWAAVCAAQTEGPERALWALWQTHLKAPDGSTAVAAACVRFSQDTPGSRLAPVAAGLGAWHFLKTGNTNEAVGLLKAMERPARTGTGGATASAESAADLDMAKTWLARLAREQVRTALRQYYVKHVEYPPSLDRLGSLPPGQRPPMTDPWGTPWVYRTTGFTQLPRMEGQRYALRSSHVADEAGLAETLARKYADRIAVRPLSVLSDAGDRPVVEFAVGEQSPPAAGEGTRAAQKVAMSPGGSADGIRFGFMGTAIVVLADANHWLVLPRTPVRTPGANR